MHPAGERPALRDVARAGAKPFVPNREAQDRPVAANLPAQMAQELVDTDGGTPDLPRYPRKDLSQIGNAGID